MQTSSIYELGRRVIDMLHSKGFLEVNVQFETPKEKGDGVMGILLHAKIRAKLDGVIQEYQTVVKSAPTSLIYRRTMPVRKLFLREVLFYTKIVPIYDNLQDQFELCVPQEMRCVLPKSYATCEDIRQETVILEDLTKKGYHVPPLTLDYDHAAIILRTVAKLHALSFIYQDRYPKRFREMADQCIGGELIPDEEYDEGDVTMHGEKVMEQYIGAIADVTLRKRCEKALGLNAYEKFKDIRNRGKVKAILHGDNWHCNYMFKYKNGRPTEAVPVDFQWARYGSIAYDFMYLFAFSMENELRRNQFHQLVDEYYSAFKGFLSLCGYDANRFCSYDEFKEEMKEQSLIALVAYMLATPFFNNPGLSIPELVSQSVYSKVTEEYKQTVNEMVTGWANLGFI